MICMAEEFKTWDSEHLLRFYVCFGRSEPTMRKLAAQAKAEFDRRRVSPLVLGPIEVAEIDRLMAQHAAQRSSTHTCRDCGAGYADKPGCKPQCPACGAMPSDAKEAKA